MYSKRFTDVGWHQRPFSSKMQKVTSLKNQKNRGMEQTDDSIFKLFLKSTSIPGLSQYYNQTTKTGKYAWIIIFFIGIALSVFQSWELIMDYLQYMIYQQSVLIMNATLPFPAVTFCNRNPIRWLDAKNTSIGQTVENGFKAEVDRRKRLNKPPLSNLDIRYLKDHLLLQGIRDYMSEKDVDNDKVFFTDDELYAFCANDFVKPCNETYFSRLIHPYYGSCITYNAGIETSDPPLNIFPAEDFVLAMFVYRKQDPDFLVRNPGMVALIHESGSPPVLSSPTTIFTIPGEWIKITINMRRITRLKHPYPSNCVNRNDRRYRHSMAHYSEKFPYYYSTEACRATCRQNRTLDKCGCIVNKIPYFNYPNLKVCFEINDTCHEKTEDLKLETCDCPLACEERLYHQKISYDSSAVYLPFMQDSIRLRYVKQREKLPGNNTQFTLEMMLTHVSAIQILFENSIYEDSSERAKYSVADFLGAIGGNIGFWTGISILVLMEVFDIFFFKITQKFSSNTVANAPPPQRHNFRQRLYPEQFTNRYVW